MVPKFVLLQRKADLEYCCGAFCRYEELSDLSEKFKIRAVPLFYFFKNGEVVEKFATRERRRIAKAINEHAGYEVLDPHS
jgi:thiol-disulfide isomerase/thioredoxin